MPELRPTHAPPNRLAYEAAARTRLGLARWQSSLIVHRGRCLNRTSRWRCPSHYAITRLTLDYTSAQQIERIAVRECALCGHVWHRVEVPEGLGEYQSVALTLLLPSEQRRWYARGRWHVTGSDAIVLTNATWQDLMAASEDWRDRNRKYTEAKAKAKAKREAASLEAHAKAEAWLTRLHERDEERAREEAEAAARESA